MKKRGFTLIELMVVIAIIGILAAIISVSLGSSRAKGRDAKRIADVRTIQLALEQYYNDNGSFPATIYLNTNGTAPSAAFAPYMPVVPVDPKDNSTPYKYVSWNAVSSTICLANLPIGYHLGAGLEDPTNSGLTQDRDATARANNTNCGSSVVDFSGTSVTTNNACSAAAGTPEPGGTETCYDVSSN